MSCNDVNTMIPVQPGAYVALFQDEETYEFRTRPVVAIAAMNHGAERFEPVSYEPGWSMETPDHVMGICHGMFTPAEAEAYIAENSKKEAQA
ncbi:hypothetical protein [Streptomyces sp. DH1]|uniref:hypothetical protein n=1 Tax=Streptomyces sp. DH1 TaxID=2857012 RepID=UPI001E5D9427|nr:hypothetical protein [Streptomyces sp. DH1]